MTALRWSVSLVLLACLAWAFPQRVDKPPPAAPASSFGSLVAALSEEPGYFDTDNLVSNERSYLHVVPELRALASQTGRGVYLGVGPDQNFSYIAHLRPSLAILIDIRRDNLLLHLLFKALFAESRTRIEYVSLLTGRAPPTGLTEWGSRSIGEIVAYVDRAPRLAEEGVRELRARLTRRIEGFGVPLSDADRESIDRFHRRFMADALALRFNTFGRHPQYDYPTLRELILEVDREGTRRSYLASEDDFLFVKRLQEHDRIVPIVGDLSGGTAMPAVANFLSGQKLQVAAFYTSNVEFYLFGTGRYSHFIDNLRRLPRLPGSLIVRSVFAAGGASRMPGYNSASLTQPIDTLVNGYANGRFRSYRELTR